METAKPTPTQPEAKKPNTRKISMLFSIFAMLGYTALIFQNFTPHDSFKGQSTRDLYMNGALTQAVENAKEEEREKLKRKVAFNLNSSTTQNKKNDSSKTDVSTDESQREPAHAQ